MSRYTYGATRTFDEREIAAWTAQQRRTIEEYRQTRRLVDWYADDPHGTREIARRHVIARDVAQPSRLPLDTVADQA